MRHKRVVIYQHRLLHYRTELFNRLRAALRRADITLELIHGQPSAAAMSRNDVGQLEWAPQQRNRYFPVRGVDVLWQPVGSSALRADLVILMQENKIISNYPILLARKLLGRKVAWWGHGANFQSDSPDTLREKWKRIFLCSVDWWFAYTQATCAILRRAGFPDNQITCLNNAIDTSGFKSDLDSISAEENRTYRAGLGIADGDMVGLSCGSLYPDKRLDLLIDTADAIRTRVPGFHLIVVGDGPLREQVEAYARQRSWVHVLGAKRGREKALAFKASDIMLNPGLVGLHIVDSFTAGLPFVTAHNAKHGPELAYLENGVNGILTPDDRDTYIRAATALLEDMERMRAMKLAALDAAAYYSMDSMVERFSGGICACLGS